MKWMLFMKNTILKVVQLLLKRAYPYLNYTISTANTVQSCWRVRCDSGYENADFVPSNDSYTNTSANLYDAKICSGLHRLRPNC